MLIIGQGSFQNGFYMTYEKCNLRNSEAIQAQVNAVNAGGPKHCCCAGGPKHCCSNEWKSQGREDECGGWVGDYLCFITPTDSCECNKYNETVEGGNVDMRNASFMSCIFALAL